MLKAPGAELCQNACGVVNEQKIFCSHQCSPECSSNKFRAYISTYTCFPAGIKDWEKFERSNKTIALNILSIPHNKETINLKYRSKYNRKCENQVILLIITNSEKWHYIALKSDHGFNRPIRSLSRLFRGITSNNHGDFYCLGCLHSFRTDNALKNMKYYLIIMIIVMWNAY